mmetsp:Transcript_11474/g.17465  ORF Transcript_11474/g.17465 Transcript_11474/m.17465 type:complete len:80 (+) Transcript_11474:80-319(+)
MQCRVFVALTTRPDEEAQHARSGSEDLSRDRGAGDPLSGGGRHGRLHRGSRAGGNRPRPRYVSPHQRTGREEKKKYTGT